MPKIRKSFTNVEDALRSDGTLEFSIVGPNEEL